MLSNKYFLAKKLSLIIKFSADDRQLHTRGREKMLKNESHKILSKKLDNQCTDVRPVWEYGNYIKNALL